jgi:DNA-binding NarL/FixJ family response regulator
MGGTCPPAAIAPNVSVLVVDDQEAFRRVAQDVIDATPGFECAGQADCGEAAVAAVDRADPDLVLLDVRMPGIGGTGAARAIARGRRRPVVVLVSGDDLPEIERDPARYGAAGFVRKERFGPRLLRHLWQIHGAGEPGEGPKP